MGLFGKKKEHTNCCGECTCQNETQAASADILVLGSGCAKCHALEQATKTALQELNMKTDVGHVTDFAQIASYGVMSTPALVVDGKVVCCGKVLKPSEIKALIQKEKG
ncbi:thioredoxin family protein [uncultured Ruthenibacterium sp.]|uniref:thioredoxin family protein n=1 Tax=uncultured Ruthenibacterium sp. TaxID=1905347 RepID=UPI00349ECB54